MLFLCVWLNSSLLFTISLDVPLAHTHELGPSGKFRLKSYRWKCSNNKHKWIIAVIYENGSDSFRAIFWAARNPLFPVKTRLEIFCRNAIHPSKTSTTLLDLDTRQSRSVHWFGMFDGRSCWWYGQFYGDVGNVSDFIFFKIEHVDFPF